MILLKEPIFIWQEIGRKEFEGNSNLRRKHRLDSLKVLNNSETVEQVNNSETVEQVAGAAM